MRYAFVNGERAEPQPKTRGACPGCGNAVTAKCGKHVGWHWAHLASTHCDPWWEPETAWHRAWKDRFPADWQEVPLRSPTNELHVADVRTPDGLVIEFQRSTIDPEEVASRESFYQKMVWVVDGTRGRSDAVYFRLGRTTVSEEGACYFQVVGRSKLFERWYRPVPIFIDFGTEGFWRIARFSPRSREGVAVLVSRELFAAAAASGQPGFASGGGPANY